MQLISGIFNGISEIRAHKFRSMLSMIGVILGISAFVSLIAVVQAVTDNFRVFIEEEGGMEHLEIVKREPDFEQRPIAHISPGLTLADAEAVQKSVPLVEEVSPLLSLGWSPIHGKEIILSNPVLGVTPNAASVRRLDVAQGRFISDLDNHRLHPVAVIGTHVQE